MTFKLYGDSCDSAQLCDPSKSLNCSSTATGCSCPNSLAANQCDCPITHYWDQSNCVERVSINGTCVIGMDYMCNLNFFGL